MDEKNLSYFGEIAILKKVPPGFGLRFTVFPSAFAGLYHSPAKIEIQISPD
jgi:hypothetical protein